MVELTIKEFKYILLFYVSKMDLVIQAKQRRLQKMHRTKELHGWIVHDPWIQNKVYKNLVSGEYKEVSYVTKDYYNPLPFHKNIEYVGIVHDDKIQYNDTIQKKFISLGSTHESTHGSTYGSTPILLIQ